MKKTKRTERIAELVQREVGTMLLTEGHGGQFSNITLTDCRVTPDLRIAHLYYAVFAQHGDQKREAVIEAAQQQLDAAAGRLRYQLGRVMRSKFTPELHFHFDETLERARRIEAVLDEIGPLDVEPTER